AERLGRDGDSGAAYLHGAGGVCAGGQLYPVAGLRRGDGGGQLRYRGHGDDAARWRLRAEGDDAAPHEGGGGDGRGYRGHQDPYRSAHEVSFPRAACPTYDHDAFRKTTLSHEAGAAWYLFG